jgi:hypothetical protein
LGDARGNKRTLRSGHQDNISAVATLHDYNSTYGLFLIVYHNYFAKNPLAKTMFSNSKDKQLEKPGHPDSCPGDWQPIQPPNDYEINTNSSAGDISKKIVQQKSD